MGLSIIEQAAEVLRAAGFRTQRAYPGTAMPEVTEIVAALQLAQADMKNQETTLELILVCPQHLGAAACEDAALVAGEALKDIDLDSVVGPVAFDGKTGLFSIRCKVTKPQKVRVYLDVPFKIGAVAQSRVVSFSAQQTAETGVITNETPWTVRLEQFFRNGFGEDSNPAGDEFTITNGEEIYHGCKWTSCKRTRELDGTRQIREGTAMYRTTE